jgi:hypothetical protein
VVIVTRLRLASLIVLLALISSACVLTGGKDAMPDSIVGSYLLNGVDPTGAEYAGHLTIEAGEGPDEYRLQWIVNGIQEGVGTLDGDVLDVSWDTVSGVHAKAHGRAVFEVQPDGSLVGTRTVAGFDAVGTEEAFPNDDVPD